MRRFTPDAPVIADAQAGTRELLAAVRKAGYTKTSGRRAAIRDASASALREIQKVQPQMAYLNILREVLPPNAIVTDELSQVGFASWYGFPVYEPRTFITSGYQGTLGSGFPTALGAKVANPDRPVVAITGDGGFMFAVAELATAVQFNIGVVTLVFNNNSYGNVRRDQRERFDGRVVASDLVNPDFVKLAESFGVGAARVTSPDHFRPALEKALVDGRPYVIAIEVPTDSEISPWAFIHPATPRSPSAPRRPPPNTPPAPIAAAARIPAVFAGRPRPPPSAQKSQAPMRKTPAPPPCLPRRSPRSPARQMPRSSACSPRQLQPETARRSGNEGFRQTPRRVRRAHRAGQRRPS